MTERCGPLSGPFSIHKKPLLTFHAKWDTNMWITVLLFHFYYKNLRVYEVEIQC